MADVQEQEISPEELQAYQQKVDSYFKAKIAELTRLATLIERPDIAHLLQKLEEERKFGITMGQIGNLIEGIDINRGDTKKRRESRIIVLISVTIVTLFDALFESPEESKLPVEEILEKIRIARRKLSMLFECVHMMIASLEEAETDLWMTAARMSRMFSNCYTYMAEHNQFNDPELFILLEWTQIEACLANHRLRRHLQEINAAKHTMQA